MRRARDWLLVAEAALWLGLATVLRRCVSFDRLGKLGLTTREAIEAQPAVISAVRWAVNGVADRAPWPVQCFDRGLAARWLLWRRGLCSTLYFGARPGGSEGVEAHVWLKSHGQDVVGCENAGDFAVLAAFS